ENRDLLAHELAHIIQQGRGSVPAIQRKPATDPDTREKESVVVKVVAFAKSLSGAVGYVSHGGPDLKRQALDLTHHDFEPGEYITKDHHLFNVKGGDQKGKRLFWNTFKNDRLKPADNLTVTILPGYFQDFMT